jgi:hypothetical protein
VVVLNFVPVDIWHMGVQLGEVFNGRLGLLSYLASIFPKRRRLKSFQTAVG